MSKQIAKIGAALRQLGGNGTEILSGTVVSVDKGTATMSVLITGADNAINSVMLNAVSSNLNGLIIYPAINSDVIIANVDGPGEYTLIRASAIDEANITIGDTKLTITANGYKITRGTESLTAILNDLFDQILALTVSTSSGPSGTPINAINFTAIKNRIPNLLQ